MQVKKSLGKLFHVEKAKAICYKGFFLVKASNPFLSLLVYYKINCKPNCIDIYNRHRDLCCLESFHIFYSEEKRFHAISSCHSEDERHSLKINKKKKYKK